MHLHIQNIYLTFNPQPVMAAAILKAFAEQDRPADTDGPTVAPAAAIALPRVGAYWPEQKGRFLGVMPGQDRYPDYALILPSTAAANLGKRPWGERGKTVDGANCDFDGSSNTHAMAAAGNALAKEILALDADGFTGYFLMSRHELRLAYIAAADAFDKDEYHWSSTQSSSHYAWVQDFNDGYQDSYLKGTELQVRLARRLFL